MSDRKCVRMSGAKDATPFLKKNLELFLQNVDLSKARCVDLACGNGRNTEFLKKQGLVNAAAYDMIDDYGEKLLLGNDEIPLRDDTQDLVLANYIFMFLDKYEIKQLVQEIARIAKVGCRVIIELEMVKQSNTPGRDEMHSLEMLIKGHLLSNRFYFVKENKGRFIAEKM